MPCRHSAIAACLFTLAVSAQASTDLLADWRAAAAHDPVYAAAKSGRDAGQAKADQARALWRPSVMLGANVGLASQRTTTTGASFEAPGFGTSTDVAFKTNVDSGTAQGWSLMLQQPLLNSERSASAKQLDLQTAVAEQQWRLAEQSLMLRVVKVHLEVLAARLALQSAESEQKAATQALGGARERFESGGIPATGVHEAQARHDLIAAQVLAVRDGLELANAAYADLTGLPPEKVADLAPQADLNLPLNSLADWLERTQSQSPQITLARLTSDLAQADVARHSPGSGFTVDLVARASDDRIQGRGPYANGADGARASASTRWVGLQLNVPLFTGGMRSAQQRESLALAEQAQSQSEDAKFEVSRQTRSAWLAVNTGLARIRALEQAQLSARKRLDATRTGFEVGDRTVLDLLDAERDLHTTEVGLQQARHAVLLGRLNLAAVAGTLDELALTEVNAAFMGTSAPSLATGQ